MDIPQKFQEFLDDTGLSMEMLRYGVSLLNVNDELNTHQELCDIRNIHYLSNVNVITEQQTNERTNERTNKRTNEQNRHGNGTK